MSLAAIVEGGGELYFSHGGYGHRPTMWTVYHSVIMSGCSTK